MKRYENRCILLYSDLHFPYNHKDAIDFLKAVRDKYNPDRVIDGGDTLDSYNMSRYPKDPDFAESDDVITELKKARKCVQRLGRIFPKVDIISSNHTDRPYKRASLQGMPRELIIPYKKMMGAEKFDWKFHEDLTITLPNRTQMFVAHHKNGTAEQLARFNGMNAAMGHWHQRFGVSYYSSSVGSFFGVNIGCLVSDQGAPFQYNKAGIIRPSRGCTVVLDSVPIPIPLVTNKRGRWNGAV